MTQVSPARRAVGLDVALVTVALALLVTNAPPTSGDETEFSAEALEFFEHEALPVLEKHCFKCHGARGEPRSHFRITTREGLIKGGDRGPAINLDEPEKSLLLRMISYRDPEEQMPPSGKLPERDAAVLARWIELRAPFDPKHEIHGEESESDFDPTEVNERTKNYWAFRPIVKPPVPEVADEAWSAHPVDAFIYRDVAGKGLTPNSPADRRELIRRAYYDLIGLPPTFEEVEAFVADDSPDAFRKVVDRLLESPHYGEKWARHWLDLVRYAESNGYERDSVKPMAWRYRDYVVKAFNEDTPYDRFLLEQLAGDELEGADADSITATGYHRLGLWDDEPADRELAVYDYLDSIVSTTGEVMLGLTIGCARCHDHKIDPIPARDYYSMLAFFRNISPHGKGDTNLVAVATEEERAVHARLLREKEANEARTHAELFGIEQKFIDALGGTGASVSRSSDLVELEYRFYRDTWEHLPEFDAIKHETRGPIEHGFISLRPASRDDAIGLVWEGKLHVREEGEYVFHLNAKDGSRLMLDGAVVTERLGRGRESHEGRARLRAGLVSFRLEYFNHSGRPHLDVSWSGPGFERRSLMASSSANARVLVADSRREPQTWEYTVERPSGRWHGLRYKTDGWKSGPGGFGRKGAPGAVVRTEWNTPEIFLRREFELRSAPESLTLTLHRGGDTEIFLNGKKVKELAGASGTYESVELGAEAAGALREGRNVLSVRCRAGGDASSIDVGLSDRADEGDVVARIAERGDDLLGKSERERYFRLREELAASRKRRIAPPGTKAMAVGERGNSKTFVLKRGNPQLLGDEVEPAFPSVLTSAKPAIRDRERTAGRRLALAEWIASPENPLTARVMANRIWQFHFGRGIVPSPSNYGRIGERPTHPELLDWLAATFVERGWSIKAMHRLLMSSRAYQMSSRSSERGISVDASNELLWRFNPRRLTAEEIRDSMLMASGRLNIEIGGPSVFTELPPEVLATSSTGAGKWGKSPPEQQNRRSLYIFVRRSLKDPMMTTFDFADTDSPCAVRFATTVPSQALLMLNSKFVNEQAEALAKRVREEAGDDFEARVRRVFELTLARRPTAGEIESARALMGELTEKAGVAKEDAFDRFALLALNLNEYIFVD